MTKKYHAKALDDALDYLTTRKRFKADGPLTVAEAQWFFQQEFDIAEKTIRAVLAT
jgi:hypothetical protein